MQKVPHPFSLIFYDLSVFIGAAISAMRDEGYF